MPADGAYVSKGLRREIENEEAAVDALRGPSGAMSVKTKGVHIMMAHDKVQVMIEKIKCCND